MVMIYTCDSCLKGDHIHCEKSHVTKGCFGGRTCRCGCHGRSEEQWKREEKNKWEAYKELILGHNDSGRKNI